MRLTTSPRGPVVEEQAEPHYRELLSASAADYRTAGPQSQASPSGPTSARISRLHWTDWSTDDARTISESLHGRSTASAGATRDYGAEGVD